MVLLATFVINLDSTIVNVALPDISEQLHASTRVLQWIIDAYNLAFAALILTGGTIGDRYGRRTTLVAGLAVFALGTGIASFAGNTAAQIALRVADDRQGGREDERCGHAHQALSGIDRPG